MLKLPAYGVLGQLTADNLTTGALLLPVAIAANYAGLWLVRRISTEAFFRIAYVLMFLIAVELIRGSLTELWRSLSTLVRHAENRVARGSLAGPISACRPLPPSTPDMTIITDPLFYMLAIPAIVALGIGKGGFAGVGMISTPLLALVVPPLQAAAILLPILLCQDAISAWVYRATGAPGISRCCCPARSSASRRPGCSPPMCRTPTWRS